MEHPLTAALDKAGSDEQEPSPSPRRLDMALGRHQAQKEVPEVVDQQQKAGGQFAHRALARGKPVEAPLVLEFVKNVLRIGPLAVKLHDLPGVGDCGFQIGDIGLELVLVLLPERPGLFLRHAAQQAAGEDHAPLPTPARELQPTLGDLQDPSLRRPLPLLLRHSRDRPAHIGRELEFEKETRAPGLLLVPGHHLLLSQADVPAIEPDLPASQPALTLFHRLLPLGGGDRVARPERIVGTHPRPRCHRQQRMKTPPTGLARVVTHFRSLLVPVFALHRRVPVQNEMIGQRAPHRHGRLRHPLRRGFGIQRSEQAPDRIVAHHRLDAQQLAHRRVFPHPVHMRESPTVAQGRQRKTLHHVIHRGRVGTRALHRATLRQLFQDAAPSHERAPGNDPSVGRQRVPAHAQSHGSACRWKHKSLFTLRVNPQCSRFLHQSPCYQRVALTSPLLNC